MKLPAKPKKITRKELIDFCEANNICYYEGHKILKKERDEYRQQWIEDCIIKIAEYLDIEFENSGVD